MRRPAPLRRSRRAALQAADVPTWSGPRAVSHDPEAMRFQQAPAFMPKGRRVYAIGDIHGSLAQLRRLHAAVKEDLAARPVPMPLVVHLGDYIDLGPDSAGVIDHLLAGEPGVRTVNLLGDHERMLLDALDGDKAAATDWLQAGGRASLTSWGLDPDLPREAWAQAIPDRHIAFMRNLERTHADGGYLFVHAGIRPDVPLDRQSLDDLVTIRQPFLWTERDFGVVVVHGHSAGPEPVVAPNRIGLDTGAGNGGRLTCAVLEEDYLGLLAV